MVDINKKINNVISLSAEDRYDYFIRKVADFEEVWALNNDGWATMQDNDDKQIIPFWPEKNFAELCAQKEWQKYKPKSISLNDFIGKWLVGMQKDNIKVAVFYKPDGKGMSVDPLKVKEDLEEELKQYE